MKKVYCLASFLFAEQVSFEILSFTHFKQENVDCKIFFDLQTFLQKSY